MSEANKAECAVTWELALNSIPERQQKLMLAKVLKTRKRFLGVSLNGRVQYLPRGVVRDFLKAMHPDTRRDYK